MIVVCSEVEIFLSLNLSPCVAAAAKSLQSCPTLCDPIDGSPPGSPVPGILQARTLEWVTIPFSSACMLSRFSHARLCATLWTAAHQAPLSTGFSRQECWSGSPFPSPLSPISDYNIYIYVSFFLNSVQSSKSDVGFVGISSNSYFNWVVGYWPPKTACNFSQSNSLLLHLQIFESFLSNKECKGV